MGDVKQRARCLLADQMQQVYRSTAALLRDPDREIESFPLAIQAAVRAIEAALREADAGGRDGYLEQHARDSAELRRLCADRDEARRQRDAYKIALRVIAEQGPSFGPDGTRDSWVHWSEIARAAIAQREGL